jgi:hypothetical protein
VTEDEFTRLTSK